MDGSLIVLLILLGQWGLKTISFHYYEQLNPEVEKERKLMVTREM